jgi:hypothetical protein
MAEQDAEKEEWAPEVRATTGVVLTFARCRVSTKVRNYSPMLKFAKCVHVCPATGRVAFLRCVFTNHGTAGFAALDSVAARKDIFKVGAALTVTGEFEVEGGGADVFHVHAYASHTTPTAAASADHTAVTAADRVPAWCDAMPEAARVTVQPPPAGTPAAAFDVPVIAMQVVRDFHDRVVDYIAEVFGKAARPSVVYIDKGSVDRILLIRHDAAEGFDPAVLAADTFLACHIKRFALCTKVYSSVADIPLLGDGGEGEGGEPLCLRVGAYPKCIESALVATAPAGVAFSPTKWTTKVSVFFANGAYYVARDGRATANAPTNAKAALDRFVCRAQHKLYEAFTRRKAAWAPLLAEQRARNGGALLGVDVGSSPGGWTYELVHSFGCTQVVAVDPGNMDFTHPAVAHVAERFENALDVAPIPGCATPLGELEFDVLVCDMNQDPLRLLELTRMFRVRAGGFLVLTFKRDPRKTYKTLEAWAAGKAETIAGLRRAFVLADDAKEWHLFGNTNMESTFTARVVANIPPQ